MEGLGALLRIENHLSAAKQRNGLAGLSVRDDGIPDLSCLAKMSSFGRAFDRSVTSRAEVIGLELNCGEACCTLRQIGATTVACGCVRECHNASSMQEAIGCHE